jgi:hypothetical protein
MSYMALRVDTSKIALGMNQHTDEFLARLRGRDIADLRWHWDEAYDITWDGRFRARRHDDGGLLEADTAQELSERIRHDYTERPVTT